uniref:Uncharacterized protein n=1 Tax=Triticum aestivum TaxID=4565 RepID=A0A077RYR6_WHEAT|nr:unnamed protein product [Triticum aestivum]
MRPLHPVGLLLSCSCLLLCAVAPVRADTRREVEALVRWKASLSGADESLGPWSMANSTSLCSWTQITCDPDGSHIRDLDLAYISLNGTLDKLDFSAFPHLRSLILIQNGLIGTIPAAIGNLASLVILRIMHNPYLRGGIPRSIGQLKQLSVLQLEALGLHSTLPEEIGNLTSLTLLDINLVSLAGSIPPTIGMLIQLRELSLIGNNLTGSIPMEIGNMTGLQTVDLHENYLGGQLPGTISHLVKLQYLHLSENQLVGHIFPGLGNSSLLEVVRMANNDFSGAFPSSICVKGALWTVSAEYNGFTGIHHQTFQNCTTLQEVDFTANNIVAELSDCFSEHPAQLSTMALSQNQLHGTLLTDRDLGGNDFSGTIPSWVSISLPELIFLRLSSNMFDGIIPQEILQFRLLQILDLSKNKLIGPVPDDFRNFTGMAEEQRRYPDSKFYQVQIHIVWKNVDYVYNLRIEAMVGIDLSGCIPEDIGNLVWLESLDLSRNQLSGEIPSSFASLKSMSVLNLSSNGLSGRIPTGNQLQTLVDPSIYSNNPGLCGFPLKDCVNSTPTQNEVSQAEDREALWLYCFVAAGFIFGFWLYWGIFLVRSESWRCAFYQHVDNMQAKVTKKMPCVVSVPADEIFAAPVGLFDQITTLLVLEAPVKMAYERTLIVMTPLPPANCRGSREDTQRNISGLVCWNNVKGVAKCTGRELMNFGGKRSRSKL